MADEPSAVDIRPAEGDLEANRIGVLNALAKRFIEQMYFRNVLAVLMIVTLCWKEIQGLAVSEHFYMLVGLVVGMYFKTVETRSKE